MVFSCPLIGSSLVCIGAKYMVSSAPPRRNPLVKEFVIENDKTAKISHLNFGVFSQQDMMRMSELEVYSKDLFELPSRLPAPHGVLDPRLGISNKVDNCKTCGEKLASCAGHLGYIELDLPVFHIGYFKHTIEILQNICKSCSRVLLPENARTSYLNRMRDPRIDVLKRVSLRKKILTLCKKTSLCPHCLEPNGMVRKIMGSQTLKLVHEKYNGRAGHELRPAFLGQFDQAKMCNRELEGALSRAQDDLSPLVVQRLFKYISDEDCELLWMESTKGRPERLILNSIVVPPVCIRPSVPVDDGAGSNEDDITVKLQEIIQVNFALRTALEKGATLNMVMEDWDFLQVQVSQLINGEMPGLPKPMGAAKPMRGLCQRLKGKQGRFRGNLSGKRVDFSARTVISPDPNLKITQVGVPVHVAKTMTYPEKVSRYNLEKLRKCIVNGPSVHPGANIIRQAGESYTKNLMYGDRAKLADELKIGDIVERHMEDDDIVLFNRQPSLHKMSIMSHRAKIMPWRTFRFNECVCAPYNADFDGDEMNMHLPQTEEARTEATMLMGVEHNLITARNGEPLVAATQDFITASYLITQKNIFLTKDQFCQLVAAMGDAEDVIDMPLPAILFPVRRWTGKQLMSLLVKPSSAVDVHVNLELEERNYVSNRFLCPKDGYVCFHNSELMSGNLAKKTLGDGSKKGLFYVLIRDHGEDHAARCMNRLAKLCARYLGHFKGFSIGIDDVTPSPDLARRKHDLLSNGYKAADAAIQEYRNGVLSLKPGCDPLQSLESELNGLLGKLRETAGGECMKSLPFHNNPRIMAECGSKGSSLNISQMVACVGQQALGGNRIPEGFINRTLPHFLPSSLHAAAKGFVANSFYSGLTATEFFFHTMGGREGLVDTAVKTAETGYMARRLMKALEDLSSHYDGTVRNSENSVVQFTYGDDGLNPSYMEGGDRPVNFDRLICHIRASSPDLDGDEMDADDIEMYGNTVVNSPALQRLLPQGGKFLEEVKSFFDVQATSLRTIQQAITDSGEISIDMSKLLIRNVCRVTRAQADQLMESALFKYQRAVMEPGEAVGAIGAQSISEPGTQMTLKTFHFAGVASMNVTLGVPRLKEIINGTKVISTPIISAALVSKYDERSARIVKARIEKTTLGQVAVHITEVIDADQAYLSVKLDLEAIEQLHLDIDVASVRKSILKSVGVAPRSIVRNLKEQHVLLSARAPDELRILPPPRSRSKSSILDATRGAYFALQALKSALPTVIVQGVPTVQRAVINYEETQDKDQKQSYHLLVEGYGLEQVMGIPGVNGLETKSNHIIEVGNTLGIEAARELIANEVSFIMNAYGISLDRRHLTLLSDIMTFKGEVLGITRFGIAKMRESVLMLASFEKTTDHLFDAAVHSRTDAIVGVSECIIMGIPIPIGTGLFKLLRKVETPPLSSVEIPRVPMLS